MSYSSEQDPLLPKGNRAPEIHGSRAQSINDVDITEPRVEIAEKDEASLPSALPLLAMAAMMFFLLLIITFLPPDLP